MKKAKVSIIVPIYNVEQYLSKCLDSLINQTFKDIEIWAISDGSPDNSVNIVKEYSKKDKRVRCIEKENGGYGSVLEYAISNIKTEYLLVCDPDDWLREDAIEKLYNAAVKNNLDLVYGSYYYVYSNDNEKEYTGGISYKHIFVPEVNKVYKGEEVNNFMYLAPSPHAKLYRTKLAKGIKFPHKVSFTDFVLYMISLIRCQRVMYLDDGLAYYLIDREGNSVTDAKPKIADFHYTVFNSIVSQFNDANVDVEFFYHRMFLHVIYINSEITKIADKNDFLEKRKLIYQLLNICVVNRKCIYPFIKNDKIRKKIVYRMLLNPVTSKISFNYISNVMYNRIHENRKQ